MQIRIAHFRDSDLVWWPCTLVHLAEWVFPAGGKLTSAVLCLSAPQQLECYKLCTCRPMQACRQEYSAQAQLQLMMWQSIHLRRLWVPDLRVATYGKIPVYSCPKQGNTMVLRYLFFSLTHQSFKREFCCEEHRTVCCVFSQNYLG